MGRNSRSGTSRPIPSSAGAAVRGPSARAPWESEMSDAIAGNSAQTKTIPPSRSAPRAFLYLGIHSDNTQEIGKWLQNSSESCLSVCLNRLAAVELTRTSRAARYGRELSAAALLFPYRRCL